jgi:hypothetical protein
MSTLFLFSFEKLREVAPGMNIGTMLKLYRHQAGTKSGPSRDQVAVQLSTQLPTQLNKTVFSEQVIKYDTELIERWGSGMEKIQQHCLDARLPEPTFEEYLRSLNLNERQITNKEYQEICNTSKRTASGDLLDMVSPGIFEQIGTTGDWYHLHSKGATWGHSGAKL